jgi:hypothetical protein
MSTEREAHLLRVQSALIDTITQLASALNAARLVMVDQQARDSAGRMVSTAQELVRVVQEAEARRA